MGFAELPEIEESIEFDINDLHKKIGQILVINPTESDIAEGGQMFTEVWFVDENRKYWLICQDIPEEM